MVDTGRLTQYYMITIYSVEMRGALNSFHPLHFDSVPFVTVNQKKAKKGGKEKKKKGSISGFYLSFYLL